MSFDGKLQALHADVAWLQGVEPDDFGRPDLAATEDQQQGWDFPSVPPIVRAAQRITAVMVEPHPLLWTVPENVVQQIQPQIAKLKGALEDVASFDPLAHADRGSPRDGRNNLLNAVRQGWQQLLQKSDVLPIFLLLKMKLVEIEAEATAVGRETQERFEKDVKEQLDALKEAVDSAKTKAAAAVGTAKAEAEEAVASANRAAEAAGETVAEAISQKNAVAAVLTSAKKLLEDVRAATGATEVSRKAQTFEAARKNYRTRAAVWGGLTLLLAGLVMLWSLWSFHLEAAWFGAPPEADWQLAVARLGVFATLSFCLFLSGRNFFANLHNEVVNRHRRDALETYEILANSVTDPQQRDAILLQAATCIFGTQSSGFGKPQPPPSPPAAGVNLIGQLLGRQATE